MPERSRLHHTHLAAFIAFCEARGWESEPVKGPYERLRMRHPEKREPLLVHTRQDAREHLSVWGHSLTLTTAFLAQSHARRTQRTQRTRTTP